jgi:hypothetical protein
VHQTVWCALHSLVHSVAEQATLGKTDFVDYISPDTLCGVPDSPVCQPANGYLTRQLEPMVNRCLGESGAPQKWKAANRQSVAVALCSDWCAPDTPVQPRTEGNQCLPNEDQMAPWSLGAIKGPLSAWSCYKSILQLQDFATMLLIH